MPYTKLILKLKGYARTLKLDGDASKGKQAVHVGRVDQNHAPTAETGEEETIDEINALSGVKCYLCKQKGHYANQCPRKAELKGKGKGKGKDGGGLKGKEVKAKGKARTDGGARQATHQTRSKEKARVLTA